MQSSKLAQYQAYAVANQTAPKTRQIVMLYDGVIRNLRQAREAIEGKRIEERYNLLVKASDIVVGLQSCLDFENGGEIAQLLYDFYSSIDARIISIHRNQSATLCDTLINELKQMRDAWSAIDQHVENVAAHQSSQSAGAAPAVEVAAVAPAPASAASPNPDEPTPLPPGGVEISA